MGILQNKCRTTAKKALAYRGIAGQNTDVAFLALSLGVVLSPSVLFEKRLMLQHPLRNLVDVSEFFFSAWGGGRGSPRRRGVGGRYLIEIPRRGVSRRERGPGGREGVCGELGSLGGGGLNTVRVKIITGSLVTLEN